MGCITNGILLGSHTRPFGGTFFMFSDYERSAVRLAALMEIPNLYVWTHDSVAVGEDGPTHQPVEHLASFRAIPQLEVIRPADAFETAEAYRYFFEKKNTLPGAMVLTRQGVPVLAETAAKAKDGVRKGAYVLVDTEGTPDVILMASGSEVQWAVDAAKTLAGEGVKARVVSVPSMEWFEEQDAEYKEAVLPAAVKARVSVEAGVAMPWYKYLGSYGRQAPRGRGAIEDLFHYGIKGENNMTEATQRTSDNGVSIWLDDLSRTRIESGSLQELIKDKNVVGVTTNPSIFQKALSQVGPYDAQLKELGKVDVETAVRELTTTDVRNATDIFREIAEATDFVDGRVSIEVDPRLAHDTENTEKQAVELWEKVNRPNAMIKIPATLEGLPAITATLAKGISVNVTLIFSLERYEQVIDAYIEGIAQAAANGHDLKHIGSVASFFVSRVDTAVDKLLEANGSDEAKALEGKAAVANARLAYELFENKFANDPRWAELEAKGAKKQRPLWASTGTKNAAYSDCKYVDELVAKHIVNTMPEKTLNALADHGNGAPSIEGTYEESHAVIDKLAELGINLKDVTDKLEADGVAAFIKSWDSVLADVQSGIDRVNA